MAKVLNLMSGKGSSSGAYPYNISNLTASALDDSVTLTWQDPTQEEIIPCVANQKIYTVSGNPGAIVLVRRKVTTTYYIVTGWTYAQGATEGTLTLASAYPATNLLYVTYVRLDWLGTMIRRKAGSYPTSETDGTLVVNSTTRNQYASVGFVDGDLADGTTYYYQAFPYSDDGYCNNEENRVSATPTYIYPSALTAFSITCGNAQATLNFTLPADAVGVKMVYKTESYPTSQTDGTVIQDASSGNTVSSCTVGGLTNDVTYYFRAFPFNEYGRYNESTSGNQATVTPQAFPAPDTLQNMSWADINTVAAAGRAAEYWAVGDTKTITFESAVLGSTSIVVKIMGFEYDDLADGSGKAKISFGMADCFNFTSIMNTTSTNVGGWTSCARRAHIIDELLPAFNTAIGANIIKSVTKHTSAGNKSTIINTSIDDLWLLSEYEVFGATTYSVAGEKPTDKSICYPIFTDAASRKKNVGGSVEKWWERSPMASNISFCDVTTSGSASYGGAASGSYGVALGFCV